MKSAKLLLRPSTSNDVAYIAARLRVKDADEILALVGSGYSAHQILMKTWMVSRDTSLTWEADGEPICFTGLYVPSLLDGVATPWAVGTDRIRRYAKSFVKESRAQCQRWLEQYEILRNHVDHRYIEALCWAERIGFSIYEPAPMGPDDVLFHKIEMRR